MAIYRTTEVNKASVKQSKLLRCLCEHPSGRLYRLFMHVTYNPGKMSCTVVHCMHVSLPRFQNALAYFATAVSYEHKMFLKLTPEQTSHFIKLNKKMPIIIIIVPVC